MSAPRPFNYQQTLPLVVTTTEHLNRALVEAGPHPAHGCACTWPERFSTIAHWPTPAALIGVHHDEGCPTTEPGAVTASWVALLPEDHDRCWS